MTTLAWPFLLVPGLPATLLTTFQADLTVQTTLLTTFQADLTVQSILQTTFQANLPRPGHPSGDFSRRSYLSGHPSDDLSGRSYRPGFSGIQIGRISLDHILFEIVFEILDVTCSPDEHTSCTTNSATFFVAGGPNGI